MNDIDMKGFLEIDFRQRRSIGMWIIAAKRN